MGHRVRRGASPGPITNRGVNRPSPAAQHAPPCGRVPARGSPPTDPTQATASGPARTYAAPPWNSEARVVLQIVSIRILGRVFSARYFLDASIQDRVEKGVITMKSANCKPRLLFLDTIVRPTPFWGLMAAGGGSHRRPPQNRPQTAQKDDAQT